MGQELRVLILADDPLVRAGLAALLAAQPGFAAVGMAATSDDLRVVAAAHQPDVLLWDLGWNPVSVIDRLRDSAWPFGQALEELSQPVVALLPDHSHISEVWSAGVRAVLRRDVEPARLAVALSAALQGLVVLDPSFIAALVPVRQAPERSAWPEARAPVENLTPRELEVLRLVAEGLPNKTIASRLSVSEHTVKYHVNAIFGKLGVASRTEAVVRATRLGLVPL